VYSFLRIASTYIISILKYQNEKIYMTSCALLHLPSTDIYVGSNSENNLSAVPLWKTSGWKEHFRVHCLCQWIPAQIWFNLRRKFKDLL